MTEYWTYGSPDGHRSVSATCNIKELMATLDGSPKGDSWVPLEVQLEPVSTARRSSDFMALEIFAPVLTARAADALGDVLDGVIELLPLNAGRDEDLFVCNVPILEGALDLNRSRLRRFSTGKIMRIEQAVFNDDVTADALMFRCAEKTHGSTYVTETFAAAIEAADGLVGPVLRPLPRS